MTQMNFPITPGKSMMREADRLILEARAKATQAEKEAAELREVIAEASQAMPEESYWSHNIDGAEEREVVEFVKAMSDWYTTVMEAAEKVDFEPVLVGLQRFMFNPDTQEFTHIDPDANIWYTCNKCQGPMRWNDAPTGGWFSHAEHPYDNHDAEL